MITYHWYSEEVCKGTYNIFMKNHPEKDMDLLRDMAMIGSTDEFRTLCNCLFIHQYDNKAFYGISYEESRELRDLCNSRVHAMLGDKDDLYNKLFSVWKSERWNGDESWRLFSDAYKPYDEAKAILTVVDLDRYLGQPLEIENLHKINDLYAHGRYWELYVEDMYSFDIDIPEQFREANRRRKAHTIRWRKFMNSIWENDFVGCRQLIDQYDKEHAAHIEECRRKNQK